MIEIESKLLILNNNNNNYFYYALCVRIYACYWMFVSCADIHTITYFLKIIHDFIPLSWFSFQYYTAPGSWTNNYRRLWGAFPFFVCGWLFRRSCSRLIFSSLFNLLMAWEWRSQIYNVLLLIIRLILIFQLLPTVIFRN